MVYSLPRLINENKPVSNFHVRVLGSNWCIIYEARLCRTLRIGKTLLEYNKLPQIDLNPVPSLKWLITGWENFRAAMHSVNIPDFRVSKGHLGQ
jgi:hypothetical protein